MSEKRGIFSLEEFYDLQVSGETTTIFDPYIYVKNSTNFGYLGGGSSSNSNDSSFSSIHKVDYSNDVHTQVSSFSVSSINAQAATGNSNFAYFMGGNVGYANDSSYLYRLDYSNDSVTPPSRGPLSVSRRNAAAVGNLNFGYLAGGNLSYSDIYRTDYNNDTATSSPKGNLIGNRVFNGAVGTLNYGYFIGGNQYSPSIGQVSTTERMDYSNDSAALTPKGNLWVNLQSMATMGNTDYGWYAGGIANGSVGSRTARIDYANDTSTSSVRSYLPDETAYAGGHGNSTHGYTAGGYKYSSIYTTYKIDYANDTSTAQPAQGIPNAFTVAATSPLDNGFPTTAALTLNGADRSGQGIPSTFGYFAGGFYYDNSSRSSNNSRIDFSNDTATLQVRGPLLTEEHSGCDGESNRTHGYIIGGDMAPNTAPSSPDPRKRSTISRIDFANDTATATRAGNFWYSQYTVGIRATGNNDFAYFIASNPSSNVSRLDYSNDNAGTIERGNITNTDVYQGAATGNLNFGYFVKYTRVERIDYSNDTAASTRKGDLSAAGSYYGAGVGNGNFGYFASGQPSSVSTIISRFDYSNDTAQGLPKGNLAERRRQFAGTGDSNFGYYGGGTNDTGSLTGPGVPNASIMSSTTRIDYANDTNTTSPKGNLAVTAYGGTRALSATSSSDGGKQAGVNFPRKRFIDNQEAVSTPPALYNYAYFSGGTSYRSYMNRIDYANDTQTIPDRSNLSVGRRHHYGVSNQNHGYFAGGESAPAGNPSTSVERLDYANDNTIPSPKGPLNSTMTYGKATGNFSYGYLASDYSNNSSSGSSVIQRIDYANDTATASNKGPLTYSVWGTGASGTLDFGVFSGGQTGQSYSPSAYNNVWKMDYSNETVTNYSIMPSGRARHGSVGNPNYGWCIAGAPSHNDLERINYSNSTLTTTNRNGSTGQFFDGGSTGNNDFGYYGGGGYPSNVSYFPSTVRRVDYANDTNTTLSRCNFPADVAEPQPRSYGKAAVSALANGFPAITSQDGTAPYSSFNFPVQLPAPIPYPSAFGYGYAIAGPGASTISRIDYSNDTATGVSKGTDDTSGTKASTSSETHGYLCGGYDPAPFNSTTINRMEYANDTAASTPKGNLTSPAGLALAGQGLHTPSYGWIWTTYPAGPLNRIDFANDTATAPNRQTTSATAGRSGTTGNQTYAWKVGGSASGSSQTFTFRLEYANDTSAVSPKGNMDSLIDWPASFGNQNYGYFGGCPAEINPRTRTSTHRIDYANDTATSVQKGSSPIPFGLGAGTSHNDNYGFMGMGDSPSSWNSRIYRVDYANDTVAASPSGPTSFGPAYANARSRMVSAADGGMTPGSPYS